MITETPGVSGEGPEVRKLVDEDAYRKLYNERLKPDADEAREEQEKKRAELLKNITVLQEHIEEQKDKITRWRVLLTRGDKTTFDGASSEIQDIQALIDKAAKDIKFVEGQVADNQRRLSQLGL